MSHGARNLGSTRRVRVARDPARVIVDLGATGVDGRVSTASGAPAADCRFSSFGLATVCHLTPGAWRVRLVHRHGSSPTLDVEVVEVRAGGQSELEPGARR